MAFVRMVLLTLALVASTEGASRSLRVRKMPESTAPAAKPDSVAIAEDVDYDNSTTNEALPLEDQKEVAVPDQIIPNNNVATLAAKEEDNNGTDIDADLETSASADESSDEEAEADGKDDDKDEAPVDNSPIQGTVDEFEDDDAKEPEKPAFPQFNAFQAVDGAVEGNSTDEVAIGSNEDGEVDEVEDDIEAEMGSPIDEDKLPKATKKLAEEVPEAVELHHEEGMEVMDPAHPRESNSGVYNMMTGQIESEKVNTALLQTGRRATDDDEDNMDLDEDDSELVRDDSEDSMQDDADDASEDDADEQSSEEDAEAIKDDDHEADMDEADQDGSVQDFDSADAEADESEAADEEQSMDSDESDEEAQEDISEADVEVDAEADAEAEQSEDADEEQDAEEYNADDSDTEEDDSEEASSDDQ